MVLGGITNINLVPGGSHPAVYVNEVDAGCELCFRVYNGPLPYYVPEGVTVTIRGTKGDGKGYAAGAASTVGRNLITVTLTEQMTAVAGNGNVFELVFSDSNGTRIGSGNFVLVVEKAALSGDTKISDSDIAYAEQVLNKLQSVDAVNTQVQQNKSNLATETATRASADTNLQAQIDQIIAPSGEAPSAAEIINARIGYDSTVYNTLGEAIRTQVDDLHTDIKAVEDSFEALGLPVVDGAINITFET